MEYAIVLVYDIAQASLSALEHYSFLCDATANIIVL